MNTFIDPTKLTLSEISKVQSRVSAMLSISATLDQTVSFIKDNPDLVTAILGNTQVNKETTTKLKTSKQKYKITKNDFGRYDWSVFPWDSWMNDSKVFHTVVITPETTIDDIRKFRHQCASRANIAGMKFRSKIITSSKIQVRFVPTGEMTQLSTFSWIGFDFQKYFTGTWVTVTAEQLKSELSITDDSFTDAYVLKRFSSRLSLWAWKNGLKKHEKMNADKKSMQVQLYLP